MVTGDPLEEGTFLCPTELLLSQLYRSFRSPYTQYWMYSTSVDIICLLFYSLIHSIDTIHIETICHQANPRQRKWEQEESSELTKWDEFFSNLWLQAGWWIAMQYLILQWPHHWLQVSMLFPLPGSAGYGLAGVCSIHFVHWWWCWSAKWTRACQETENSNGVYARWIQSVLKYNHFSTWGELEENWNYPWPLHGRRDVI